MKNSIARGVLALTCAAAAVPGCASGQVYDGDPANWRAPDQALEQPTQPYRISVTRLLKYVDEGWGSTPPLPGWSDELARERAYLQARMYIAGALDIDPQDRWCIQESGVPPYEVEQALLDQLRDMPGEQSAAEALHQAAASRFPCQD